MARTVRDASLESRAARARLKAQKKPHWRSIDRGLHIGYYKGGRGGAWVARRYCGEGRYQEVALGTADDTLDADGRAVLNFTQAQAKARDWFHAQVKRSAGEAPEDDRPFTVGEALDTYLVWFRRHRKSEVATRSAIEARIRPVLGAIEAGKLTATTIRRWHEALAEQPARVRARRGAPPKYRHASASPEATRARQSTANRLLTVLKAALNHVWAHQPEDRKGAIAAFDPEAWRSVKPFRNADAARLRYLQADEARRLLNACPPDFRALVRGALVSGCRYGELCRLEVEDYNSDAGALLIRQSKSGKPRHVPLDDDAVEFFAAITAGRPGDERMFRRVDGGAWGKSHQARPLLEACRAARIDPPANFHSLRHTWASHRVMKGAPLLVVAQVLGHSDTRMVEKHYSHLAPSYVRDAVRATSMDLGAHESGTVTPLRPVAGIA